MFSAFKDRRPWAAALITFVFSPVISMLYLSRWILAFVYLAAAISVVAISAPIWGPREISSESSLGYWLFVLGYRVGGSVHAYYLARGRAHDEPNRWYARWYVLAAIALAPFMIRFFLYRPFDIPSVSMAPALVPGDYLFVSERAYDLSPPQRGDVIVFRVAKNDTHFVKRVVGLPGDRVQLVNGIVQINGVPANPRPLGVLQMDCTMEGCPLARRYVETLPGGQSHVIIRFDDSDSPLENTPVFTVPPDSYFVLGDNRDNSVDSRMDDVGYVNRTDIVGRVAVKFFDGSAKRWAWDRVP